MKKILCVLMALTMVFGLFAVNSVFVSAESEINTGSAIVVQTEDTDVPADVPADDPADDPAEDPVEDPVEPEFPTQEELSQWFSEIITMVLSFLSKICEVLFENIIW